MRSNYAILARGQVVHQQTLVLAEEGGANEIVGAARFHVAPSNRLFVIFHVSGTDPQGQSVSENRLLELNSNGTVGASVRVPLQSPLAAFFTATVRGGSPPSQVLDLLGLRAGLGNAICYARIRLW